MTIPSVIDDWFGIGMELCSGEHIDNISLNIARGIAEEIVCSTTGSKLVAAVYVPNPEDVGHYARVSSIEISTNYGLNWRNSKHRIVIVVYKLVGCSRTTPFYPNHFRVGYVCIEDDCLVVEIGNKSCDYRRSYHPNNVKRLYLSDPNFLATILGEFQEQVMRQHDRY